MFRTIGLLLVVAVAAFLGYVAMLPSAYRVERTAIIDAPPATVFQHVNDLSKWESWSPWAKRDPNAKNSFEGPKDGKGAIFKWAGNDEVGEGQMTIVDSKPADSIAIKLDFVKPFAGTSDVGFKFQPEGSGTKVAWSLAGEQGFFERAICTLMGIDMDSMIGADYEAGLKSLKAVAEGKAS